MVQWLTLPAPNASGPGSIPGQETKSHMPQLRVHMLQPQIQCAKMKSKDPNQDPTPKPSKYINIKKKKKFSRKEQKDMHMILDNRLNYYCFHFKKTISVFF